jgi:hypothetical protein
MLVFMMLLGAEEPLVSLGISFQEEEGDRDHYCSRTEEEFIMNEIRIITTAIVSNFIVEKMVMPVGEAFVVQVCKLEEGSAGRETRRFKGLIGAVRQRVVGMVSKRLRDSVELRKCMGKTYKARPREEEGLVSSLVDLSHVRYFERGMYAKLGDVWEEQAIGQRKYLGARGERDAEEAIRILEEVLRMFLDDGEGNMEKIGKAILDVTIDFYSGCLAGHEAVDIL